MHQRISAERGTWKAIEAGLYATHLLEQGDRRWPQTELEWVAEAGAEARRRAVEDHLPLVLRVAGASGSGRLPSEDRAQEAAAALVRAVEKFDHTLGTTFASYALWWLAQTVRRAEADQGGLIRIPVHTDAVYRRAAGLFTAQGSGSWRRFTDDNREVLQSEGINPDMIRWLAELRTPVGLEFCEDGLGADWLGGVLVDEAAGVGEALEGEWLCRVLLDPLVFSDARAVDVLGRRFGFCGEPQTLDEIGRAYGVGRERIRQIEKVAIGELRACVSLRDGCVHVAWPVVDSAGGTSRGGDRDPSDA
ncbi:sigma-70 family RNA polymerase sigma factor [Tessaracoccus sp. MC1865]|uniref:sigma-70 family RNA polymerase sigma factor n=1 Tax=Tessaracoccus sp. MC1865 TaxID=2760310 RepID=UPI0016026CBA|nr:sigma-70 family RNA polymerase sigma factor [Tessaracoccus sp. MC1865]MBB1483952.1 sigma-70 family RNA polymerase sigma factor [Tessaracoccus sp. MC1865]QTO37000.1 sigma-70 family RNA polymerase sigma factor [Tessaracoccus sp. MC1865]